MSSESPEPKGFASSSPDEECGTCAHPRYMHSMPNFCAGDVLTPQGDDRDNCPCHAFVPADAETAGEPEAYEHDWSEWGAVYHGGAKQWRKCFACGETESRTAMVSSEQYEPEAPECKYPGGCPLTSEQCPPGNGCAFDAQLKGIAMMPRPEAQPPRRPPYAVAYALASGELYEIALPGDAVATVEHGVLKVSHPAGVDRMVQVKPMGEQ